MSITQLVTSGPLILALPVAAAAGAVTFVSPCCLPLVPGYLSFVTGMAGAGGTGGANGSGGTGGPGGAGGPGRASAAAGTAVRSPSGTTAAGSAQRTGVAVAA